MPFRCCGTIKPETFKPNPEDKDEDNEKIFCKGYGPPVGNINMDVKEKSLPNSRKIVHRPVEFGGPCDCCGSK